MHGLPQASVTVDEHGPAATFSGPSVSARTSLVGAPQGQALKGQAAAVTITTGADGYRVVLSLAETDA